MIAGVFSGIRPNYKTSESCIIIYFIIIFAMSFQNSKDNHAWLDIKDLFHLEFILDKCHFFMNEIAIPITSYK